MKKPSNEAMEVSVAVNAFLRDYAPKHKTGSESTLRSYETAIRMFLTYIGESAGVTTASLSWKCFSERCLEGWMGWLRDVRGNSPATCNVRLASLREFLRYAAGRDASLQLWYQGACSVKSSSARAERLKGSRRRRRRPSWRHRTRPRGPDGATLRSCSPCTPPRPG